MEQQCECQKDELRNIRWEILMYSSTTFDLELPRGQGKDKVLLIA